MRRRRYTVYYTDREPEVVLAYGGLDAKQWGSTRGTVKSWREGDIRIEAKSGGWRLNRKALNEAIDLIGLKLPVKLRTDARVGSTNGNYRFRNGGHDIMLKTYLSAEQATKTLWHEPCHAMQAERAGAPQEWNKVVRSQKGIGHDDKDYEREAIEFSNEMSNIPLTYPRKSVIL